MDFPFSSAVIVTMPVGGPVIAGVIVQRDGTWVAFLRRHGCALHLLVAGGWAGVAIINFWETAGLSSISAWLALVLCVLALCLAFFARSQSKQAH